MKNPAKGGIVGIIVLVAVATIAFMVSDADYVETGPIKIGNNPNLIQHLIQ